jgi:putative endonuclease
MYYVYVLKNFEGRLYIGFTSNLEERVKRHQDGKAGWTRGRGPWELVHYETFTNRIEALRRERNLKRGKPNKELRSLLNKAQS